MEAQTLIRKARPADLERIVDFNCQCAQETESLRLDRLSAKVGTLAILADPSRGAYYLAEISDEVVGQSLITYEWSDWRGAWIWWLQSVYVMPKWRAKGLFSAIYKHIFIAATKADASALRLYVDQHNTAAANVYSHLGMRESHYRLHEVELNEDMQA